MFEISNIHFNNNTYILLNYYKLTGTIVVILRRDRILITLCWHSYTNGMNIRDVAYCGIVRVPVKVAVNLSLEHTSQLVGQLRIA